MTAKEIQELRDTNQVVNVGCSNVTTDASGNEIANGVNCSETETDFALNDIQIGDEILCDYGEYVVYDPRAWESLGFIKGEPEWDDEEYDDGQDDGLDS